MMNLYKHWLVHVMYYAKEKTPPWCVNWCLTAEISFFAVGSMRTENKENQLRRN